MSINEPVYIRLEALLQLAFPQVKGGMVGLLTNSKLCEGFSVQRLLAWKLTTSWGGAQEEKALLIACCCSLILARPDEHPQGRRL